MGTGQGSLTSQQKKEPVPGPPFLLTAAINGLSVSALPAGKIVLGQNVGAVGNPAALLSNREIPLAGFSIDWLGNLISEKIDDSTGLYQILHGVNPQLSIDPIATQYFFGNAGGGNATRLFMDDVAQSLSLESGGIYLFIDVPGDVFWLGDVGGHSSNTYFYLDSATAEISFLGNPVFQADTVTNHYRFGALTSGNTTFLDAQDTPQIIVLHAANGVHTTEAAFLIHTDVSLTNNAGAALGTLTNAPFAGDPSKWIAIDDFGTTRYFPVWGA
jgi:hypothetical protein